MGSGGVIIILKKIITDTMQTGVTPSGRVKLWHVLCVTHALAFVAGLIV